MTEATVGPIILRPSGPAAADTLRGGKGATGRPVPIVGLDCSGQPDIADALRHGQELIWAADWWGVFQGDLLLTVATAGPPAVEFAVAFDPRAHRDVLEQARKAGGWIGLGPAPLGDGRASPRLATGVQFEVSGLRTARRLLGGNT